MQISNIAKFYQVLTKSNLSDMSFQGYLKTIKSKTGKEPADFRKITEEKGFTVGGALKPEVKAGEIVKWLKEDFDLGQGHAMAIYALLKGLKDENSD